MSWGYLLYHPNFNSQPDEGTDYISPFCQGCRLHVRKLLL